MIKYAIYQSNLYEILLENEEQYILRRIGHERFWNIPKAFHEVEPDANIMFVEKHIEKIENSIRETQEAIDTLVAEDLEQEINDIITEMKSFVGLIDLDKNIDTSISHIRTLNGLRNKYNKLRSHKETDTYLNQRNALLLEITYLRERLKAYKEIKDYLIAHN